MKELMNLNTKQLIIDFKGGTLGNKLPKPYDANKGSFIPHCLAFFSKVPLIYHEPVRMISGKPKMVSMSKTLANIPHDAEGDKVFDLLWIFKNIPRGKLIVGNQVSNSEYCVLTPIFMYAHKLYNNVCYSDWDREDKKMAAALGYFLDKAFAHAKYNKVAPIFDSIETLRKIKAKDKKYTDWMPSLKHSEGLDSTEGEETSIEYGREILIMTLQFWVANAAVRDTKANLLDIYQFGRIPKALDAVAPKAEINTRDDL